MSEQRLLVAYPVGLLYGCFALLSVFNVGAGKVGAGK
jgi:protein YIPF5/7